MYHDTSHVHMSHVQDELYSMFWEVLDHPPYSPNLFFVTSMCSAFRKELLTIHLGHTNKPRFLLCSCCNISQGILYRRIKCLVSLRETVGAGFFKNIVSMNFMLYRVK
jgi:hypothetical protein